MASRAFLHVAMRWNPVFSSDDDENAVYSRAPLSIPALRASCTRSLSRLETVA